MHISKQRFTQWLKDKGENSIVGLRQSARYCPIAMFFNETQRVDVVYLDDTVAVYNNINHTKYAKKLPKWAGRFVIEVDDRYCGDEYDDMDCVRVYGSEALDIMERI